MARDNAFTEELEADAKDLAQILCLTAKDSQVHTQTCKQWVHASTGASKHCVQGGAQWQGSAGCKKSLVASKQWVHEAGSAMGPVYALGRCTPAVYALGRCTPAVLVNMCHKLLLFSFLMHRDIKHKRARDRHAAVWV